MYVVGNNDFNVVNILINNPHIRDSYIITDALIEAATTNADSKIVYLLLDYSLVDPSLRNNKALVEAVRNYNLEIFDILLDDGRANPCEIYDDIMEDLQNAIDFRNEKYSNINGPKNFSYLIDKVNDICLSYNKYTY